MPLATSWDSPFFPCGGSTLFLTFHCEIEKCHLAESLNVWNHWAYGPEWWELDVRLVKATKVYKCPKGLIAVGLSGAWPLGWLQLLRCMCKVLGIVDTFQL